MPYYAYLINRLSSSSRPCQVLSAWIPGAKFAHAGVDLRPPAPSEVCVKCMPTGGAHRSTAAPPVVEAGPPPSGCTLARFPVARQADCKQAPATGGRESWTILTPPIASSVAIAPKPPQSVLQQTTTQPLWASAWRPSRPPALSPRRHSCSRPVALPRST